MEQQQFRERKERENENLLRHIASTTGTSSTEARATQRFQSPPSSPQRSATQFQSPPSPPPYTSMYSSLPPLSSQEYGLLLGPGSGQQTQIFDMAASDRADSGFDVANRELDEHLKDLYDAANVSINSKEEKFYAKQERC